MRSDLSNGTPSKRKQRVASASASNEGPDETNNQLMREYPWKISRRDSLKTPFRLKCSAVRIANHMVGETLISIIAASVRDLAR